MVAKTKRKSKPVKKRKAAEKPPQKTVLILRTCAADMTSHGGFKWPESGHVECSDWSPEPKCGNGLHGLLWGEGNGELLNWSPEAKWIVVSVPEDDVVATDSEKVKFPRGEVVFCGDRLAATDFLVARLTKSASVVGASLNGGYRSTLTGGYGSTLTGGYGSTLTGGDWSTLTGGDWSTLTGGYGSTLTGGYWSTLTGGYWSTLTGGYGSTLTGGYRSTLVLSFFDGIRKRLVTLYVGENGIEPNVAYRLNEKHEPVKA